MLAKRFLGFSGGCKSSLSRTVANPEMKNQIESTKDS
jgi:hypothetical protein